MDTLGLRRAKIREISLGKLELELKTAVAAVLWRGTRLSCKPDMHRFNPSLSSALTLAVQPEPINDLAHVDRYVLVVHHIQSRMHEIVILTCRTQLSLQPVSSIPYCDTDMHRADSIT